MKFARITINQSGMTLPEILIVVVILASMATVLIGQVNKALGKARVNQVKILISEVSKSLDMYNADCGFYPTTDQGIQALVQDTSGKCTNWIEPYLPKVPRDPWGQELLYTSDGNTFQLKSLGSDKTEGGTGTAADITNN